MPANDKCKAGHGSFTECIRAFKADDSDPYVAAARTMYHVDGKTEIDGETVISDSNDGAYVLAWVWVGKDEI